MKKKTLDTVECRKQCDMYIQTAASLECAYRALMNAGHEVPVGGDLLDRIVKASEDVRKLTLEMMERAVLKGSEGRLL